MPLSPLDAPALRLAAIVESSDDAIVSKDLNGIITSWNRAAERMFGYTAAEAVGTSILLIIPPERHPEEDHVLSKIRAGERVDHFETIRRRKDGSEVHVSLTVSPILDSDGTVIGASKIARDITERKLTEAALAELDHRLLEHQRALREAAEKERRRAAFLAEAGKRLSSSLEYEQTLAAIAELAVPRVADWCAVDMVDDEGRVHRLAIEHADPDKVRLAKLLEERYPALQGAPAGATAGGVPEVLRSGRPVMVEAVSAEQLRAVAQDDQHLEPIRQLELTSYICVPLSANGRAFGALTFVTADSGRRYTADDLSLAQEVAALASLAVENSRAYQRANDANRLKDHFLATLSHELRTPLSAILGYTRLLRLGKLTETQEVPALEVVERNALSLKQIIDDVLDVSRIVSGKLRLNPQPVRLTEIIGAAVTTVLPAADAKGLQLETVADRRAALVSGDPERLQQVIWNLLSNAVKFTPAGGRVTVSLSRVDSDAEIAVRDTGQGVDPEFLPHMFERFRQADSGFSRQQGGLGLGLAIVRDLVEMHGGSVKAESEGVGKGTTVRVRLPLLLLRPDAAAGGPVTGVDTSAQPAPTPQSLIGPNWAQGLQGVRVLVVDDEEDAARLVCHILAAAGAETRSVGSASEALAALEREVPDVLVSDIGMPSIDGLALIRRLRQSAVPQLQSLPALALSAYARTEDRITTLASGYDMHMAKPADPAELVTGVASLARR